LLQSSVFERVHRKDLAAMSSSISFQERVTALFDRVSAHVEHLDQWMLIAGVVFVLLVLRRYVAGGRVFHSVSYNPGWIPFLGVVPQLALNPVNFLKSQVSFVSSDCPVSQFLLAGLKITLFHDPFNHQFFFLKSDDHLSFREAYVNMFESVVGEDAFAVSVPIKQLFQPGMSSAKFSLFERLIEKEVEEFNTSSFLQRHASPGRNKGEYVTDLFKAWSDLVLLTTARCLVGKEVHQQEGLVEKLHRLEDGFNVVGLFFPGLPLPTLRKRRQARDEILDALLQIVQNRKAVLARGDWDASQEDMLTVLLNHADENKLDDRKLAGLLLSFIFVGQVQTFAAAAWTVLYILERPQLHAQIMQEINDKYPHAAGEMDVLQACIRESIRLAAPILMFRKIMTNEIKVKQGSGSFTLPRGNLLAISPCMIHRDPRIYKRADEFLPERFYDAESDLYSRTPMSYVGFGGGRHTCLGEHFAYMECKHMIAQLLRDFDCKLTCSVPPPNFKHMGGLVIPEKPCPLIVKRKV
jgi:sterol 14-demethylase